jgi:ABC-type antimicrobial peptide transport system permease subunit
MREEVIAVFIPIIITLVIGVVLIVNFYLQSKEKQMLIEKGLSSEEIKKFFEQKRDGLSLMKIGIISIFFGLGLGFGMMLQDATSKEYWIPFLLFVATGIGFVTANVAADKMKKNRS